ncbi:unnamed protein product, partial [Rotaria magnacalcarata]
FRAKCSPRGGKMEEVNSSRD